jgi:TonB family protein
VLRRRGVTGEVRLQFVIGCDGRVDSTTVMISSTTDSLFTGSAIAAIVGTEFSPAMLNGRAVAYREELAIRFRLSTGP